MGMHSLEELILKWQQERLTTEQMIGQLLQHLGVVYERLRLVERQMGNNGPPMHMSAKDEKRCTKQKGAAEQN